MTDPRRYSDDNPFAAPPQRKGYSADNPFATRPAAPAPKGFLQDMIDTAAEQFPVVDMLRPAAHVVYEGVKGAIEPFAAIATRPGRRAVEAAGRGEYSPGAEGFAGKLGVNIRNPDPTQRRLLLSDPGMTDKELGIKAAQAASQIVAPKIVTGATRVLAPAGSGAVRTALAVGAGEAAAGAVAGAAYSPDNPFAGAAMGAALGPAIRGAIALPGAAGAAFDAAGRRLFDVGEGLVDDAGRVLAEHDVSLASSPPAQLPTQREAAKPRVAWAQQPPMPTAAEAGAQRRALEARAAELQAQRTANSRIEAAGVRGRQPVPPGYRFDAEGRVVRAPEGPALDMGPKPLVREPLTPSVPVIEPRPERSPIVQLEGARPVEPGMPLAGEPGGLRDAQGRPILRGVTTDRLDALRGAAAPPPPPPPRIVLPSGEPITPAVPVATAAPEPQVAAPALQLTPEPLPVAQQQTGLFTPSAGTESSRPLATVERAMQQQLEKDRQLLTLTADPEAQRQIAGRIAITEKLLNRDKAITSSELAMRARAAEAPVEPVVVDPAQLPMAPAPAAAAPRTLKVYHATDAAFDKAAPGTMFTTSEQYAGDFAAQMKAAGREAKVREAEISVKNPADLRALGMSPSDLTPDDIARLRAEGYDSAHYRGEAWVVFDGEQAKFAAAAAPEAKQYRPVALSDEQGQRYSQIMHDIEPLEAKQEAGQQLTNAEEKRLAELWDAHDRLMSEPGATPAPAAAAPAKPAKKKVARETPEGIFNDAFDDDQLQRLRAFRQQGVEEAQRVLDSRIAKGAPAKKIAQARAEVERLTAGVAEVDRTVAYRAENGVKLAGGEPAAAEAPTIKRVKKAHWSDGQEYDVSYRGMTGRVFRDPDSRTWYFTHDGNPLRPSSMGNPEGWNLAGFDQQDVLRSWKETVDKHLATREAAAAGPPVGFESAGASPAEKVQRLDQLEGTLQTPGHPADDAGMQPFIEGQGEAIGAERARVAAGKDLDGKWLAARSPAGARRPVEKVSTEGLIAELHELTVKQQDALQRAQYNFVETQQGNVNGSATTVVPLATRSGGGASKQAKALQNLKDYERIWQDVEGELQKRGMSEGQVAEALSDFAALEAERAAERAGMQGVRERGDTVLRDENGMELFAGVPLHKVWNDPIGRKIIEGATGGGIGSGLGYATGDTPEEKDRRAVSWGLMGAAAAMGAARAVETGRSIFAKAPLQAPPATVEQALRNAGALIDFDGKIAAGIARKQAGSLWHRIQRAGDKLANVHAPIERLGEAVRGALQPTRNPGQLLAYVKSGERTIETFIEQGIVDPVTREVSGPSFKAMFAGFEGDDNAIRTALTVVKARRDLGRGESAYGGDLARMAEDRELLRWAHTQPLLSRFMGQWELYTEGLGRYAVGSGLWTEAQWQAMKASDALYVPYKRLMESPLRKMGEVNRTPAGTRLANVTSGVQGWQGSTRAVENIAEAMAEYTAAIVRRADRYRVGASLFDAAAELGPAGELLMTRVDAKQAAGRPVAAAKALQAAQAQGIPAPVADMIADAFNPTIDPKNPVLWRNAADGSREYATIHSHDLLSALEGLNTAQSSGVKQLLDITLRPLRRIFTATTTGLSPRFSLATNPMRDVIDALAKSEGGLGLGRIGRGYYEGVLAAFGKSHLADEAALAGLGGTSQFSRTVNPKVIAQHYAPTSTLQKVGAGVRSIAEAPLRPLEAIGEASDRGPRLGEYLAALKEAEPKLASGEWTTADARLYAANRARRVTIDFASKPGSQTLRALDDYIPFFGVALKAPVSMGRAAMRNPRRFFAATSSVALAAAGAWAIKRQLSDEAQAKMNDRLAQERAGGVFVPLDGTGENLMRWQLGGEFGVVASAITAALDKVFMDDPNSGRLIAAAIARALPPGVGELTEGNFTGALPIPGVQQAIENLGNKRAFTGMPVEPARMERLPVAERRFDSTAPTFDLAASVLRRVGWEEASPLKVENLLRGVTSQATPFITAVTDPLARLALGDHAEPRIPIPLGSNPVNPKSAVHVTGPSSSTESERDFYAIKARTDQARAKFNDVLRTGATDEGVRRLMPYRADLNPEARAILQAATHVVQQFRDVEQLVRERVQARQMSPDEGRRVLDGIKRDRQAVYRNAVTMLREKGVEP